MRTFRRGMTLFELLIVMMIVGIVYSIGMFTINKEKISTSRMDLSTLKTTLSAIEHSGAIRLICNKSCQECRVWSADNTPIATLDLFSDGDIQRYGFDRNGDLKPMGKTVVRVQDSLIQACFDFTLYPDDTSSALILKDNHSFYVYTPVQNDKPFMTNNPEALRNFVFDKARYPLKEDDYYVGK